MRLAEVEPAEDGRDVTKFDCQCGFEYHLPPSAGGEQKTA
jgi:hypothetical protein